MLEIDDDKKIPAAIRPSELLAALEPLCALLNVTPQHFFSMKVEAGKVTLVVPVPESAEDWCSHRPPGRKGANVGGQTGWSAELAQHVVVEVLG